MPSEIKEKEKPAISMRHSKLTASEAAILAGELNKPSWESKNEGIHERVSFEDSIWGFDLAGGSFYKTPLRVTFVKTDSRAEKAGIRPGDKLLRINDIDTSTLTIQEAHEIIIESGVHLRIAVTAPDDLEDSYNCWQDEIEDGYDSEEERRKQAEIVKKREIHAKVSSYWSLQWPWVSKRRIIYRESNCFMVPSKYENKHKDKFPEPIWGTKITDDIVLHSKKSEMENTPSSTSTNEINVNENEKINNNIDLQNNEVINDILENGGEISENSKEDENIINEILSKSDIKNNPDIIQNER